MKRKLLTTTLIIFVLAVFPAVALAGSAILHWQPNSDPDLAGYRIYYGTAHRSYGPYIPVGASTTSYTLNGLVEGNTYYFALTAVDTSGNESGYSAEVTKNVATQSSIPSNLHLITNRNSPQVEGTVITISASATGGSGQYEYRFWIRGPVTGNTWKMVQDYSSSSSYGWDTSGAAGQNLLGVWVRNAGSGNEYENYTSIPYTISPLPPVSSVSLSTNIPSPQNEGTSITINASATGGTGSYEYKFWLKGPSTKGKWQLLRDYSTSSTYVWDSSGSSGANRLGVWVKNAGAGDSKFIFSAINYSIKPLPLPTAVSISPNLASPQNEGTSITLNASATGGTGSYEYRFWLKGPSTEGKWQLLRDYSTSSTYVWDSSGSSGVNKIGVWVRDVGAGDKEFIYSAINYVIQ